MKTDAALSPVVAGFKLKSSVYDGKILRPFNIDPSYPSVFDHYYMYESRGYSSISHRRLHDR